MVQLFKKDGTAAVEDGREVGAGAEDSTGKQLKRKKEGNLQHRHTHIGRWKLSKMELS